MAPRGAQRALLPLLSLLYLCSGAAALAAEALWQRPLLRIVGAQHSGTATLLAAFVLGLALGSALGARPSPSVSASLRRYALAEALVALWSLCAPTVFSLTESASTRASLGARVALAFALVLPPTVAMGTTFPSLGGALGALGRSASSAWSSLQSANMVGGAAGVLCGLLALERLGARNALWLLSGVQGAVTLGALALATLFAKEPEVETAVSPADDGAARSLSSHAATALAFALGVLSFAAQLCWNRALAVLLGSTSATFASVLAAILLGNAAGALRSDGSDSPLGLRRRLLWLAMLLWAGTLFAHVAPYYLSLAARRGAGVLTLRTLLVALVVVPPSWQLGALFPSLTRAEKGARVGASLGALVFASSAGNLLGSLLAGFVLLPALGAQGTLSTLAGSALALACLVALAHSMDSLRATLSAAALALALGYALSPTWDRVAFSAGTFRVGSYRALEERSRAAEAPSRCTPTARFARPTVRYFRDGASATVAVLSHRGPGDCTLLSLRVNGKAEGSVLYAARGDGPLPESALLPEGDLPTNVLLGALPALAGGAVRDALLVGWGTGFTARALLAMGAARVDGYELEPAVLEAAREFSAATLVDPRVRVLLGDARILLARRPEASVDVLVSQPSNPWVAGAGALFSREYFSLARSRLRPGGRMMAWVQLYESDAATVATLVGTFRSVFPRMAAYRAGAGGADLLLLGATEGGPERSWSPRLREPDAGGLALLRAAGFESVRALEAEQLEPSNALLRAGDELLETDDRPVLEFRTWRAVQARRSAAP